MAARLPADTYPLVTGTVTDWGTIDCSTYTAYKMTDGQFVPFTKIHERRVIEPLIVFG